MLVLCYPKCSTCQKALAWLDAHDIAYEVRDIKEQNPGRRKAACRCAAFSTPAAFCTKALA